MIGNFTDSLRQALPVCDVRPLTRAALHSARRILAERALGKHKRLCG